MMEIYGNGYRFIETSKKRDIYENVSYYIISQPQATQSTLHNYIYKMANLH